MWDVPKDSNGDDEDGLGGARGCITLLACSLGGFGVLCFLAYLFTHSS